MLVHVPLQPPPRVLRTRQEAGERPIHPPRQRKQASPWSDGATLRRHQRVLLLPGARNPPRIRGFHRLARSGHESQRPPDRLPAARDTVRYGENETYPSLAFHFKGLTAVATQWKDSLLPSQPADLWLVLGENGLLYGRLPLTAPWAAFRDALGAGIAHGGGISIDEHKVTVMFCAHPRVFFDFDAPASSVPEGQTPELSGIPNDARVKDVAFFPRPNPTWHC